MRWRPTTLIGFTAAAAIAGCAGGPGTRSVAQFDFGPLPAAAAPVPGVASVEVAAPSWLTGGGIAYRLAWLDPRRRHEYAESRWAAPPAELLSRALAGRLAGGGRCRLHLDLDEFIHVFDSPTASRWEVAARATLSVAGVVRARRPFAASVPAPSADARGGVAAAATAIAELADRLGEWAARTPACLKESS